jgi:hypothetical protein
MSPDIVHHNGNTGPSAFLQSGYLHAIVLEGIRIRVPFGAVLCGEIGVRPREIDPPAFAVIVDDLILQLR